jgi:hypothetical protein
MLLRRWYNNDFFWRFNLMAPPFSSKTCALCGCLSVMVGTKRPTTTRLPLPFPCSAPNNHPKGVGGGRILLLFSFLIYIHFASLLLNFSSTHVYINVNVNLFLFGSACLLVLASFAWFGGCLFMAKSVYHSRSTIKTSYSHLFRCH